MSGARIERYSVEPESDQQVGNKLHSYAPGPQPADPSLPFVPLELLTYLRVKFPNASPPQSTHPDHLAVEVAKVWGQQEMIAHLESLLKPEEK